jgi:hypothetical protein
LFNLLVNPLKKDYALSWHRDDVKATATPEEEEAALKIEHHAIQWNAALYDDECLSAVPRSHSRIRTSAEREANLNGPMPGGQIIALKAGETVFYNNNIRKSSLRDTLLITVHVGKYNLTKKRRTLHGCYGSPPAGDTTRARVILQHGLAYTRDPAFVDSLPESLKPMVKKLNSLQEGVGEVGYSQDD